MYIFSESTIAAAIAGERERAQHTEPSHGLCSWLLLLALPLLLSLLLLLLLVAHAAYAASPPSLTLNEFIHIYTHTHTHTARTRICTHLLTRSLTQSTQLHTKTTRSIKNNNINNKRPGSETKKRHSTKSATTKLMCVCACASVERKRIITNLQ